jgi:hypothetical protein
MLFPSSQDLNIGKSTWGIKKRRICNCFSCQQVTYAYPCTRIYIYSYIYILVRMYCVTTTIQLWCSCCPWYLQGLDIGESVTFTMSVVFFLMTGINVISAISVISLMVMYCNDPVATMTSLMAVKSSSFSGINCSASIVQISCYVKRNFFKYRLKIAVITNFREISSVSSYSRVVKKTAHRDLTWVTSYFNG